MTLEGSLDARAGEDAVRFRFTVTNAGDESVELQFSDACKADFAVLADGEEIWRFSDGRMFAQMISTETLDPDESAMFDAEWSDHRSGAFTAVAELCARDMTCEARTELSV